MRVHTGDLHGNMSRIIEFIQKNQGKENCYLFVHGDAGINYDLGEGDRKKKQELQKAVDEFWQKNQKECNILLIRGIMSADRKTFILMKSRCDGVDKSMWNLNILI